LGALDVNLVLQHITVEWLDRVVELDRICFGQLWSHDQYQRELDSANSDILILINRETAQILAYGCVWAILDEAHITIIAVHPDYHHQGFGTVLLSGLMQCAIARDLARATLEVKVSNIAAIGLYEKFGFTTAGRRKKYYDSGEDALILWKGRIQASEYRIQMQKYQENAYQYLHRYGYNLMVSLDTETSTALPLTP
jgi:[ribosomal protein S18]-alanine N-acetyltransferase